MLSSTSQGQQRCSRLAADSGAQLSTSSVLVFSDSPFIQYESSLNGLFSRSILLIFFIVKTWAGSQRPYTPVSNIWGPYTAFTAILIHNNILEAHQTLSRSASDKHGYSHSVSSAGAGWRPRGRPRSHWRDCTSSVLETPQDLWEEAEKLDWGEVHLESHAEPAAATTRHRWREHFHAMLCSWCPFGAQLGVLHQHTASWHRMCRVSSCVQFVCILFALTGRFMTFTFTLFFNCWAISVV